MKIILTAAMLLFSATVARAASPAYELAMYPAWIKNQCLELTSTRTRVGSRYNWNTALECAVLSWEQHQRDRLLESQIEANNAAAELDRQLVREMKNGASFHR